MHLASYLYRRVQVIEFKQKGEEIWIEKNKFVDEKMFFCELKHKNIFG